MTFYKNRYYVINNVKFIGGIKTINNWNLPNHLRSVSMQSWVISMHKCIIYIQRTTHTHECFGSSILCDSTLKGCYTFSKVIRNVAKVQSMGLSGLYRIGIKKGIEVYALK